MIGTLILVSQLQHLVTMATGNDKETERQRGKIFADSQREFLNGKSVSSNYQSTLESRIRQRVIGAIEDLQLLDELDKADREYIVSSNKKQEREGVDIIATDDGLRNVPTKELFLKEGGFGLMAAFSSFFRFYYKTLREDGGSKDNLTDILQSDLEKAEQQFLAGTNQERYLVEATVEINSVREVDIEDAKERFDEDGIHGVTKEELIALEEAGHFTLQEDTD